MAINKTKAGVIGAAVLATSAALIGQWEGLKTTPYKDPIGIPTVCYGQTGDFAKTSHTKQECEEKLTEEVAILAERVRNCIADNPPDSVLAAFVSASYNIGDRIACTPETSTAARHLRDGNWAEACAELPKWNKAGGKVLRGLTNRRRAEYELCMRDIVKPATATAENYDLNCQCVPNNKKQ